MNDLKVSPKNRNYISKTLKMDWDHLEPIFNDHSGDKPLTEQETKEHIEISFKEIMYWKQRLTELYVKHNSKNKTYDDFTKVMDRDTFMSAQESLDFGLVDQIIEQR
jgi:hypothetical protein